MYIVMNYITCAIHQCIAYCCRFKFQRTPCHAGLRLLLPKTTVVPGWGCETGQQACVPDGRRGAAVIDKKK